MQQDIKKWKPSFRTKSLNTSPVTPQTPMFAPRPRSNTVPSIAYVSSRTCLREASVSSEELEEENRDDESLDQFASNILTIVNSLQKHQHEVLWNI
ncbi:hypothetical protein CAAN1_25S00298 [[Candida] anglica]|uniref:Uncharacterized protein n=1 Tax=[Candida] anglica TaxID=148631 RepID=A0ABP0EFV4_9ASCO